MTTEIPQETIETFARTIHLEATKYGFGQIDIIRLINALMDASGDLQAEASRPGGEARDVPREPFSTDSLPLTSSRLRIRLADAEKDLRLLQTWLDDEYGRHFLISCATAQHHDIRALLSNPANSVGIVELHDGLPIGAVAFLDIDGLQGRAELRKLIGVRDARGKGYAEEATALWIRYGTERLGLEKIYVSTLQTHLANIKLNEAVGFRVEGILRSEIRFGDTRHDVLRMGLEVRERPPDTDSAG